MHKGSSKRVLKATGQTVARIRFDAGRTAGMRGDERHQIAYHVARLLAGEGTAASEWEHFGITIEVEADSDGGEECYSPSS